MTDEKGAIRRLGPGDAVFLPAGTHSVWHITQEVRKLSACRHSMPRSFGLMLLVWNRSSTALPVSPRAPAHLARAKTRLAKRPHRVGVERVRAGGHH